MAHSVYDLTSAQVQPIMRALHAWLLERTIGDPFFNEVRFVLLNQDWYIDVTNEQMIERPRVFLKYGFRANLCSIVAVHGMKLQVHPGGFGVEPELQSERSRPHAVSIDNPDCFEILLSHVMDRMNQLAGIH